MVSSDNGKFMQSVVHMLKPQFLLSRWIVFSVEMELPFEPPFGFHFISNSDSYSICTLPYKLKDTGSMEIC